MRVLIAEDDPVSRRVLQSSLLKWGYEVDVACDGLQAWEAISDDQSPRMLVLDWMMPGMDGIEICQALRDRAEGPYVYTILLTAKSQRDDVLLGLNAGADDYIMKPFDPNELRIRLRAGKRVLDIQAQLLAERESQRMQAVRDPLTGLPNRLLFGEQLADRIAQAARDGREVAVMFLDLDHFKSINDTLGHNVGDELLKSVAQRVTGTLRESDVLARMGGDEFTLVLGPNAVAAEGGAQTAASAAAERILTALSRPFSLGGRSVSVTSSIGIGIYPRDGADTDTLVQNADTAMYAAKAQGRNAYRMFWAPGGDQIAQDCARQESFRQVPGDQLRQSLADGRMVLHYQVWMDIHSAHALGVEALIRWNHPELGLLPPSRFIDLAEATGVIEPITEWVLEQACAQNKAWQQAGYMQMEVAVNLSCRLLHGTALVPMVEAALNSTGLQPQYLCLETTESAILKDPDHAIEVLHTLRTIGVRVRIDDFGSGYSSLGNLKHLPLDAVKVDPSFVRGIASSKADASMVGAIVAMAHELGLRVTAEGVETLEQLELLKSCGCDEVQGYFISRPVPADEIVHLLAEGRPPMTNWRSLAA